MGAGWNFRDIDWNITLALGATGSEGHEKRKGNEKSLIKRQLRKIWRLPSCSGSENKRLIIIVTEGDYACSFANVAQEEGRVRYDTNKVA